MNVVAERLWETLERYSRYGATPAGGVSRPAFSPPDVELRYALAADCRALGIEARFDAAANVLCTRPGSDASLPTILIGSHLDSVPDGGRYDGPLGVVCALEVLRVLTEQGTPTRHPVTLVSFTGEEATSFGTSTFGSRALAGRLPDVATNRLPDGRSVREALRDAGGDWDRLATVRPELGPIACFVEVHIEQGTRLESARQIMAPVSGVCGIYRQRIVFRGAAGHAGTTAMDGRHDALRAAARLVLAVPAAPAAVASDDPAAVATVGYLQVAPNSPNVIPGEVTLITDLRTGDAALLAALARHIAAEADLAARAEGVSVEISTVLDQMPVTFDARLRQVMNDVVTRLGGDGGELTSLAGHDAVHVQSLAPAGMLFVRCAGGVSHQPAESVTPQDAALAAEALLHVVRAVDTLWD